MNTKHTSKDVWEANDQVHSTETQDYEKPNDTEYEPGHDTNEPLNYANIAYGVKVAECSSFLAGCEPENVLLEDDQKLWLSHEGLPQHITLDVRDVSAINVNAKFVSFGWYCWHSYSTNPKTMEVSVSVDNENFDIVQRVQGSANNGLCSFILESPLFLRDISYIKIAVQEVFGGEQVYINRLYLFDEGEIRESKQIKRTTQISDSISSSISALSDERDTLFGKSELSLEERIPIVSNIRNVRTARKAATANHNIVQIKSTDIHSGAETGDRDEVMNAGKYYPYSSDYLDKETLDWLYEPIDDSSIDTPRVTVMDDNNKKKKADLITPSSSVESGSSVVFKYTPPGEVDHDQSLDENNMRLQKRLGVIVHRSGNVEVNVSPTVNGHLVSSKERGSLHATSKTQSTEAISEKSIDRPTLGYRKQNDDTHIVTHLDTTLDTNGGPPTRLLSVYNNDKLKFQLSDMEKEITRLKFKNDTPKYATSHGNSTGSGFASQVLHAFHDSVGIGSEALYRTKNYADTAKFPEVQAGLNGGSAQQTIMGLTSMLKRYNKHVAYLESRLSATENHVVELQSRIKELSHSKEPKIDSKIRVNQKLANTSYGQDRVFRQKVVDILNSWEQDLINGVLDPHINAVVEKLQQDLYSQIDVNLDNLRNEVKRIHTVVDDRLKPNNHGAKTAVTSHNDSIRPSTMDGGRASVQYNTIDRKVDSNHLRSKVKTALNTQSKKKYVELINKLREKLEEKQRTVEAIRLVQEKAKRYNKKKKQYKATVHTNVHSNIGDKEAKIFEIGIEES